MNNFKLEGLDEEKLGVNAVANGYVMDKDIADMDKQLKKEGKKGIVYDPSSNFDEDNAVENLPDVKNILDSVGEILEVMLEDEMIALQKEDGDKYEKAMEQKFPSFSFRYFALFKQIISGEDLGNLFVMLEMIEKTKNGKKSFREAESAVGMHLATHYDLPTVDENGNTTGKNKKKKKKKR